MLSDNKMMLCVYMHILHIIIPSQHPQRKFYQISYDLCFSSLFMDIGVQKN